MAGARPTSRRRTGGAFGGQSGVESTVAVGGGQEVGGQVRGLAGVERAFGHLGGSGVRGLALRYLGTLESGRGTGKALARTTLEGPEELLRLLHQLPERSAAVEGQLDDRSNVVGTQIALEALVKLLEDLHQPGEIERDVVLQHKKVEVERDERLLAGCPLLEQRAAFQRFVHLLYVLPHRVHNDDGLLYPV
eukprot:CAMPEP_0183359152 /NCGR_PEP_ID=MMETSP0164_2-20130417/51333_1 /TAXON_ID=221442 /ORGANISM="Coccolithus pelagicus ssp braarudi, Strain PLY182g" /LENGTH=191 /DNA_ID=CAMNT_0025533209 /DNA_START=767 /DNA_END=1342 /DNA_ORIENTATION=+